MSDTQSKTFIIAKVRRVPTNCDFFKEFFPSWM